LFGAVLLESFKYSMMQKNGGLGRRFPVWSMTASAASETSREYRERQILAEIVSTNYKMGMTGVAAIKTYRNCH
jgi:hypothetical protein